MDNLEAEEAAPMEAASGRLVEKTWTKQVNEER